MSQTQAHVARAITVEGVPGETAHAFYLECGVHDHASEVFKIRVLRAERPSIWATLLEVPGRSHREYYTLTPAEKGLYTTLRAHLMCKELASAALYGNLADYRGKRTQFMENSKRTEMQIFAANVAAAYDG